MWDVLLVSVQHVSILPHYECGKTIELQHTVRVHSVYTASNNQIICGTNTVKIYQPHVLLFFKKKNPGNKFFWGGNRWYVIKQASRELYIPYQSCCP